MVKRHIWVKMKEDPKIWHKLSLKDLLAKIGFPELRKVPAIVVSLAFVLCVCIVGLINSSSDGDINTAEFEAGKVAERDVIAENMVSYVDEEETLKLQQSEEAQVPAIFKFSSEVDAEVKKNYQRFTALSRDAFDDTLSLEDYKRTLLGVFPEYFSGETLDLLYADENRDKFLEYGANAIDYLLDGGIFLVPATGIEPYNAESLEVLHISGQRLEREILRYSRITTLDRLEEVLTRYIRTGSFSANFANLALGLIKPFLRENVFFSPPDTAARLAEVRAKTEPVLKVIEPGTRVIRKGFVVSSEAIRELNALNISLQTRDPRILIGRIILFILLGIFLVFLSGQRVCERSLKDSEIYLLTCLSTLYIIGAALVNDLPLKTGDLPISVILPTALFVMLPAILIHARIALMYAMALPLAAFLSGSFDIAAFIFALVSGTVASYALEHATTRMDMIRAGMYIGAANCLASIASLLITHAGLIAYPVVLFWSAFSGIASGMLVLGILPVLENALHAATVFKLIELSDLNSPTLKALFDRASGTYSHSLMVARLAEAGCLEIGANPLLARVGAYYHDIGKMEKPEYYTENQHDGYNKHNELTPQLSATVLRSHVKLGIEKAHSLGLPQAVINIIAQHHGNGIIQFFYVNALKQDPTVKPEDFSYPGSPPRSREAAVVMLADVCEATVKSLQNRSQNINATKIETTIQERFDDKVKHGQLSQSELTFRDLTTIKNAFTRVLVGHYHHRIAYPKLPVAAPKEAAAPQSGAAKEAVAPQPETAKETATPQEAAAPQSGAAKETVASKEAAQPQSEAIKEAATPQSGAVKEAAAQETVKEDAAAVP
ncbi:HD family phosphohydrolase [Spirochaetia bacterium]|nr:HD family phosphohydrolase [Spirochaetia bacterium]